MAVVVNYPGTWNGEVPVDFLQVAKGTATINTGIYSRLELLEHLAFPVFVGLERVRVLDVACGTGEWLVQMALLYSQTQLVGYDWFDEARDQARDYISELALGNLEIVDELPTGEFDIILHSRPLQHMEEQSDWIKDIGNLLAPGGVLLLSAETTGLDQPAEEVSRLRAGELNREETEQVLRSLLNEPAGEGIDCWGGLIQHLEANGLTVYMGVHPVNYEPKRYLEEEAFLPEWVKSLSLTERGHIVERLGSFERHYVLCGKGMGQVLPQIGEPESETLIPHLSPYASVNPTDDRYQVGLTQRYMMLQPGVELEDISLPSDLFPILQMIDGKLSLEQLHRNFLPMSWERFLSVIEAAVEVEIVYLHRRR